MHILKEIQEQSYEFTHRTHILFVDFQQTYDRIKWKQLFKVIDELGINNELKKLINTSLQKIKLRYRLKVIRQDHSKWK